MSVNKAILVGNLAAKPELRFTQTGQAVANFRIATNDRYKDKEGNAVERTEWHRIVVWGKQAESCEKYLDKGRQVYVEGEIRTNEWDDKDGNKRYTTEVIAQKVQFLSGTGNGNSNGNGNDSRPDQAEESFDSSFNDDDIPF